MLLAKKLLLNSIAEIPRSSEGQVCGNTILWNSLWFSIYCCIWNPE